MADPGHRALVITVTVSLAARCQRRLAFSIWDGSFRPPPPQNPHPHRSPKNVAGDYVGGPTAVPKLVQIRPWEPYGWNITNVLNLFIYTFFRELAYRSDPSTDFHAWRLKQRRLVQECFVGIAPYFSCSWKTFTVALLWIHRMIWYIRQMQWHSITSMPAISALCWDTENSMVTDQYQKYRKGVSTQKIPVITFDSSIDTGCLQFKLTGNIITNRFFFKVV